MDDEREHGDVPAPGGRGGPSDASGGDSGPRDAEDPLLEVRAALDEVDQLPLDERADVFERTHGIVVDELRALELG